MRTTRTAAGGGQPSGRIFSNDSEYSELLSIIEILCPVLSELSTRRRPRALADYLQRTTTFTAELRHARVEVHTARGSAAARAAHAPRNFHACVPKARAPWDPMAPSGKESGIVVGKN